MRSATHQIHGMEVEEEDPVVTTTCLGVADGALNLAGEDIQHGVASTSTRAVAATTESEETPEKTVTEADATAASTTAAAMAAALEGRSAGGAGAWRPRRAPRRRPARTGMRAAAREPPRQSHATDGEPAGVSRFFFARWAVYT